MATVLVAHQVADFDAWKAVFDEHGEVRRALGCTGHRVYRQAGDNLNVVVATEWPSQEAAQAFASDPSLPQAMQRAGVTGPPRIEFLELAEVAEGADA